MRCTRARRGCRRGLDGGPARATSGARVGRAAHRATATWPTASVADYIPALAQASPDLFGIAVAGVGGEGRRGRATAPTPFTIQSVVKPFQFALVCEALGHREARERLGVNATGLPVRLGDGGGAGRRRPDQPDGQLRRDRHHEPRPRAYGGAEVGLPPRRALAVRRPGARASTRGCSPRSARPTTATRRWRGCWPGTARMYFDADETTDVYTRSAPCS